MNLTYLLLASVLFTLTTGLVNGQSAKKADVVHVIFDTDMGPYYDDVGSITLLHAFAD